MSMYAFRPRPLPLVIALVAILAAARVSAERIHRASTRGGIPLTNLDRVRPGLGLPRGWRLRGTRGVPPPLFAVTDSHALRVESTRAAGFAVHQLAARLPRSDGTMRWRWRTGSRLTRADLRLPDRDDSPIRILVAFADRRTLFYSWGNTEPADTVFLSWTGPSRAVVVARTATDADGSWHVDCHRPFADYQRAFGREPPPITAVGVSADTEQLPASSWAEVADLAWWPPDSTGGEPTDLHCGS